MNFQNRKRNRLKNYDYSENGLYFITICTKDRVNVMSEIIVSSENVGNAEGGVPSVFQFKLTDIGKIVDANIRKIDEIYDYVSVINYVIMPDHIHLILLICDFDDGTPRAAFPTKSIPLIINALKSISTKQIGHTIWQKSYHDHIIRSHEECVQIYKYIENNPFNWSKHNYNQNKWR